MSPRLFKLQLTQLVPVTPECAKMYLNNNNLSNPEADSGMFSRAGAPTKRGPTKGAAILCKPEKWAIPE